MAANPVTLQTLLLSAARLQGNANRLPPEIIWKGRRVKGVDVVAVPEHGVLTLEFLYCRVPPRQGIDIKVDGAGWIELTDQRVSVLRTWYDPMLETVVRYPYFAPAGVLRIWNVYERFSNGEVQAQKWEGNAGMSLQSTGDSEHIYECSHGLATAPDFSALRFRIKWARSQDESH